MRQPISDAEIEYVRNFLQINAQTMMAFPLTKLSNFLLERFGWPISSGRKRAKIILDLLRTKGLIKFYLGPRGGVLYIGTIPETEKNKPGLTFAGTDSEAEPKDKKTERKAQTEHRRKIKIYKKGIVRQKRGKVERGHKNEQRFYLIMKSLLDILKLNFSDIVLETFVEHSGTHNPKKGKVDLQDHWGEDVVPIITVQKDGEKSKGRIIYDAKSSSSDVLAFNESLRYYPGQETALRKKAIWVNKKRTDREMVSEIMDDFISVGLLPGEIKEKVLEFFKEI